MSKTFVFPASPQSELWAKLTAKQQAEVAAVFRHMKKGAQIQLCYILDEYITDAVIPEFQEDELLLSAAFVFLTGYEMPEKAPWRIVPFQGEGLGAAYAKGAGIPSPSPRRPYTKLKDIISDMFPSFRGLNPLNH